MKYIIKKDMNTKLFEVSRMSANIAGNLVKVFIADFQWHKDAIEFAQSRKDMTIIEEQNHWGETI